MTVSQAQLPNNWPGPRRFAMGAAAVTAGAAAVGLAMGVFTPPRSGPYCLEPPCVGYPYTEVAAFFPRDYWWMIPASVLALSFAVLVACCHDAAAPSRRVYSLSALAFAVAAATLLAVAYFIQWAVVQPSLLLGESQDISLWSMYNPHGVFIALEDLGYLLMGLAFIFIAPVFGRGAAFGRAIRAVFTIGGLLTVGALPLLAWRYGTNLEYRYEVAAIAFDWLTLIASGILLYFHFRRMQPVGSRWLETSLRTWTDSTMRSNHAPRSRSRLAIGCLVVLAVLLPTGCSLVAPRARMNGVPSAAVYPREARDLPAIQYNDLPREAKQTIALINQGGPFPYDEDGQTFENREGILPDRPTGYYQEYTVETPGSNDRGARRIVAGDEGELYYTDDHYESFSRVVP